MAHISQAGPNVQFSLLFMKLFSVINYTLASKLL